MDTSKEYISMCEKAIEIQKLTPDCNKVVAYNRNVIWKTTKEDPLREELVWLPRQDQLQEMVINKFQGYSYPNFILLERFYNRELNNFTERSFEIGWLCFVMKENYNKIWNSEKEEWELID